MEMLRIKVGIVCLLILAGFSWMFMSMQQSAIENAIEDSREDRLQANPEKFREAQKANEALWQNAFTALREKRFKDAGGAFGQASGFEYEIYSVTHEVKPGVKAKDWFDQQKRDFADSVLAEFDGLVRRTLANPVQSDLFEDFYATFRYGVPELEKRFQAKKAEIAGARIRSAGNWFRLAPLSREDDYSRPVVDALKAQWNPSYNKTLVSGPLLDDRERDATWMILEMNSQTQGVSYSLVKRGMTTPLSVKIPETVIMTFKLRKLVSMPTSWDSLPPITVFLAAPESIKAPGYDVTSEIEKIAEDHKTKLLAMIKEKIPGIPKFQLYPGRDVTNLTLTKNGAIDRDAARMMTYLDPTKLSREAFNLSKGTDTAMRDQLMELAIEQDLDSLAPWLTGIIEKADEPQQQKIWNALRKNADFGQFFPVLKLLEKSPTDEGKANILKILGGWLFEEKIRQAYLAAIARRDNSFRVELCQIFLKGIPPDQLGNYSSWLSDADKNVAHVAFSLITNRDPDSQDKMMTQSFGAMGEEFQMRLLSDFHYNSKKHGKDIIDVLKKSALQASSESVKQKAMEILLYDTSNTPEGWKALQEVAKTVQEPEMASKIKQALAANVSKANPAQAAEYQLSSLLGTDKDARKAAAHKYFRDTEDVDRKMKTIVPHLKKYIAEPGFLEALLRGFSEQGMSKLKDPGIPEFEELINMAVRHSEAMVRYFGYTLSHRAWAKGQKKFAEILRQGLAVETNQWARDQGSNLLKAIDTSHE